MIELLNMDCIDYLRDCEDNAFDLAIVDPPYGIGMSGGKNYARPSRPNQKGWVKHEKKQWDLIRPNQLYWDELFRISKNQIVWGANYFVNFLTPSMGWIYWGKFEDLSDFSDGELAWTSFDRALRSFKLHPFNGCDGGKSRIHPTQKPVKLYDWLLSNYAKEGDRILDTHLGSGSSAIAAHYGQFDFVGIEIDEDYFNAAKARFEAETAQLDIFSEV